MSDPYREEEIRKRTEMTEECKKQVYDIQNKTHGLRTRLQDLEYYLKDIELNPLHLHNFNLNLHIKDIQNDISKNLDDINAGWVKIKAECKVFQPKNDE